MGLKAEIAKIFAKYNYKKEQNWINHPIETQEKIFHKLITEATKTQFGKDHQFHSIKSYEDFKSKVPINENEGLKTYIENIHKGESDVLWKEKQTYFDKTSGTTSGAKYIPITNDAI